jgi:hypothetical protein
MYSFTIFRGSFGTGKTTALNLQLDYNFFPLSLDPFSYTPFYRFRENIMTLSIHRRFLLAPLFLLPLSAWSGPKTGRVFEVVADMMGGSSGSGGFAQSLSDDNATQVRKSGSLSDGQTMVSSAGWELIPGIFGGGPVISVHTAPSNTPFGNPSSPARFTVSAAALSQDYLVFTSPSPIERPLRVDPSLIREANRNLSRSGTGYTRPLEDRVWEILLLKVDGRVQAPRDLLQGEISLPYRDLDNDGVVDGTSPPVRAETLSIWWLDEDHSLWVKVPESRVDPVGKTVSAPVRYASVFVLMGAPSYRVEDAFAFPVPWRPSGAGAGSGAGQTGTSAGITFSNLPSIAKIRIYSLSGTLVRELDHSDGTPQMAWDVRNGDGDDLATGTYIYVVDSDREQKRGKLMVVR